MAGPRNGMEITTEIRLRLREKRGEMGLSLQKAALLIGVSKNTLQAWERGRCRVCHYDYGVRLLAFLNGEYDRIFSLAQQDVNETMPPLVNICMRRILTSFLRLSECPEKQQSLLKGVAQAIRDGLSRGDAASTL